MTTVTAEDLNRRIGFDCVRFDRPIRVEAGIYRLTDDPNIDPDSDSPEYIGYDAMGERYDRPWERVETHDAVAHALLRSRPDARPHVLDVGAGTGRWAIPLATAGAVVVAADISTNMLLVLLRKAKNAGADVVACRANALSLPFRDHSFDMVTVDALFHLVKDPERVVMEIKRVLGKGGALATFRSRSIDDLPQETQEENRRYDALVSEAYKRHGEIAKAKGQKHTPRPGWWRDKRHENLRQYFAGVDEIPVPEASNEWTGSFRQWFQDLHNLAFSDMVRYDPAVNVETMAQLEEEIETKHGRGIWDLRTRGRATPVVMLFHD